MDTESLEVYPLGVLVPLAPTTRISFSAFSSELSEAQQKLLVKSMEKKILPVQLKLVRRTAADTWESLGGSQLEPVERHQCGLITGLSQGAPVLSQELMHTFYFHPCFFLFAVSQLEVEG